MDEFDKLKDVFAMVEASWHPKDEERFGKFLRESSGRLTLGNFRSAFEEAQPGRMQGDEAMQKKIDALYEKYEKRKR